ncbi:MAG: glycosyl hydrolase [Kiritimatiellae bacterium]|nr:glycosyl hydrolase [Kiritimatiellia bacterium]
MKFWIWHLCFVALICMYIQAESGLPVLQEPSMSTVLSDPAMQVKPPVDAIGYPDRSAGLDALPGFNTPPPGYGEVPFWWWTGDDLDVDRMLWQVKELHKMGISGVQVNYSHYDTPGWLTEMDEPALFTEEWWKVYSRVSEECAKYDMGIGLSTYTIDWPRGAKNLFYDLFYCKPELNALELTHGEPQRLQGGETKTVKCIEDCFAVRAYEVKGGILQRGGIDLKPQSSLTTALSSLRPLPLCTVSWTAPDGEWEIWSFGAKRKEGSLNPLMSGSGDTVVQGFFQKFQDHNPGKSSKGLNYFFNDELHIGLEKFAWNPDFIKEFQKRKGYDLLEVLPAMWTDMGNITPKVLMDYADLRMTLMEERYFKPIYDWHASRGMTFGCDPGSRGLRPNEFGDYFRANRWYSAPGHDTPGGSAHLIKGKVSSSIANLYQRPRVWLEGYHSLGWGASPERIMFATRENYLYGCTLLNLHGLYYSTYGSHWEWAPPCYHFRMPYWEHMKTFLGYFERLSYLMSQGHTLTDVAVVYPVAPYEAEMNGKQATTTAFDLGNQLMRAGINFEFIDNDSLARAEVRDGRLVIDSVGVSYQALVIPNMDAVRWQTIEKAAAFAEGGGHVFCVGAMPSVSDHAGRSDPELTKMNDRAFKSDCRLNSNSDVVQAISKAFVQDVRGVGCTVRALHRRIGPRDVYLVMDATPGSVVEFRTKGAAELWDPWTGKAQPLRVVKQTETLTQVELPLESYEAQVVVFTPAKAHVNPPVADKRPLHGMVLSNEWQVSFEPTMDNRYGDFRLPVTPDNRMIGVEARRFACAGETPALSLTAMLPSTDDSEWSSQLHGYGPKFYLLGPVPKEIDFEVLDAQLASLKSVDPAMPVKIGITSLKWRTYDFSWRFGKEGDLGHQGYHGLKRVVTDDFICLGKTKRALNETQYLDELEGGRYYLWTSATVPEALQASICVSKEPPADKSHTSCVITPGVVYVNGSKIADLSTPVKLKVGANPTLVRYDHAGRGHFVMRRADVTPPADQVKLAMRWHNDPGVIPFDIHAGANPAQWLRFVTAPGTTSIRMNVHGKVKAWIDGKPMDDLGNGHFVALAPSEKAAVVALRVLPESGLCGAASIPEPVIVETNGRGTLTLGDWSKVGILNNYSGGVRYRTTVNLTKEQTRGKVEIDLGSVVATAEVVVNGKKAGVLVAPPWKLDVSCLLKPGDNRIEILVFNTLANHYQTIPSRYRGKPVSGLMGPVHLQSRDWKSGVLIPETAEDQSRPKALILPLLSRKILATVGDIQVEATGGSLAVFDKKITNPANLLRQPGLIKSVKGLCAHKGGGSEFSALFNGSAGNSRGKEGTMDDGKTFVGMADGNTLELYFDSEKAPAGVNLKSILTYSGHADARASQKYTLYASTHTKPGEFVKVAEVNLDCTAGLNEVSIISLKKKMLLKGVRCLRFVFKDGAVGFNVYREIAVLGFGL